MKTLGRNWISLQPLFFFFFFYRIRNLWEENVIVGKANGAGTTKCRNLPKTRDFQRHMHAVI